MKSFNPILYSNEYFLGDRKKKVHAYQRNLPAWRVSNTLVWNICIYTFLLLSFIKESQANFNLLFSLYFKITPNRAKQSMRNLLLPRLIFCVCPFLHGPCYLSKLLLWTRGKLGHSLTVALVQRFATQCQCLTGLESVSCKWTHCTCSSMLC